MNSVPIKLRNSWTLSAKESDESDPIQNDAAGVPNYQANSQDGPKFEAINEG